MRQQGGKRLLIGENYIAGGIGDPTLASPELAERIIAKVTRRIVEALVEDLRYEEMSRL